MFDKILLTTPRASEHHTHVTMVDPSVEKGARFLNDVQREAEKRILNVLVQEVPAISAKLVHYDVETNLAEGKTMHFVAFTINGHEHKVRLTGPDGQRAQEALNAVSERLTEEILRQMSPTTLKALRF